MGTEFCCPTLGVDVVRSAAVCATMRGQRLDAGAEVRTCAYKALLPAKKALLLTESIVGSVARGLRCMPGFQRITQAFRL